MGSSLYSGHTGKREWLELVGVRLVQWFSILAVEPPGDLLEHLEPHIRVIATGS